MAGQAKKGNKRAPESLVAKAQREPVKIVHKLVHITEEFMAPRVVAWQRYRRKYRRGLKYLRADNGRTPMYFSNYIFSVVETIRANLTRNLPSITIRAKGKKEDQVASDLLGKVLKGELNAAQFKKRVQGVVQHGLLTGLSWFKVGLDPNGHNGEGALAVDVIAAEDMLVDPLCLYHEDARWFIHVHRDVPHERIFATYGLVPESVDDGDEGALNDLGINSDRGYHDRGRLRPAAEVAPVSDVYECWLRNWDVNPDMTVEEDPETGDEREVPIPGSEKPAWYIVTVAENTDLRVIPSPYDHNRAPFVPFFDVEDDGAESIYYRGVGEVEEIEPQQDKADALDQRIYQNIALTANRQKYVSIQSGLNVDAMDNTAGRNYKVTGDPSKAVYHDSPPALSREVFEYRSTTEMLIQTVSGVFDVTQGRRPTGITAGRAIQSLKESADVRISFKTMSLAETIKEVADIALQIILQFYDGKRIVRLTDADKDTAVVILDEYPEVEGLDLSTPETKEQFKKDNGIDLVLSDINFDYDIEVDPDSALPASRADRGQLAADLFRLGAIDRQALLETLDFPNMHEIIKRLGNDVTGKNAGDPQAEAFGSAGQGQQQLIEAITQQLVNTGMPAPMIEQLVAGLTTQLQGEQGQPGGGQPPQGGGNFPPQVAMK